MMTIHVIHTNCTCVTCVCNGCKELTQCTAPIHVMYNYKQYRYCSHTCTCDVSCIMYTQCTAPIHVIYTQCTAPILYTLGFKDSRIYYWSLKNYFQEFILILCLKNNLKISIDYNEVETIRNLLKLQLNRVNESQHLPT